MAITTLNGVIAGFQAPQLFSKAAPSVSLSGKPASYWGVSGIPSAGTYNSTPAGGTYSSTSALVAGQIPHTDPPSGNSYLGRLSVISNNGAGMLLLCDKLWDDGGLSATSVTAQTINSVAWPARDNTGTTNGAGVLIGLEVSAVMGASNPNTLTISYTNSAGTASRTGTNVDATVTSAAAQSFFRLGLQAGDVGVQSIQTFTLGATWTSGTINLVAYRILAMLEVPAAAVSNSLDSLTSGMPQIFNGTVPFLIFTPQSANAAIITGTYTETQG